LERILMSATLRMILQDEQVGKSIEHKTDRGSVEGGAGAEGPRRASDG
jgi:hypothetical protein